MSLGNVYYDPVIKLEKASSHPSIKRRSQLLTNSRYLEALYYTNEIVDL